MNRTAISFERNPSWDARLAEALLASVFVIGAAVAILFIVGRLFIADPPPPQPHPALNFAVPVSS